MLYSQETIEFFNEAVTKLHFVENSFLLSSLPENLQKLIGEKDSEKLRNYFANGNYFTDSIRAPEA